MKKLKAMFLIILMLFPSLVIFYPNNANAKTIADLRRELDEIEKRENENNNNISLTESEIATVQNEIGSIYNEINTITNDIKTATKEIEDLGKKIIEKDESIKKLMSSLQKTEGNSFYIEYLFGADSIEEFIYRYAITEQITEYNSDLIIEMQDMIKKNEDKKKELATRQKDLENRQSVLSVKITDLTNSKVKLYELGTSIEDEIKNAKAVIQMYKDAGCGENEDISTCANKLLPSDTKFWRPFGEGFVSSEFGYRNPIYNSWGQLIASAGLHEGIDLTNGYGYNNKIYSIANGKVVATWYDQWGGNQITVHHNINGKAYSSSYAHLSRILVKKGDVVTKDSVIGMMGDTGSATGPHLHLAISTGLRFTDYSGYSAYAARCLNPRDLINFPSGERYWSDKVSYYR